MYFPMNRPPSRCTQNYLPQLLHIPLSLQTALGGLESLELVADDAQALPHPVLQVIYNSKIIKYTLGMLIVPVSGGFGLFAGCKKLLWVDNNNSQIENKMLKFLQNQTSNRVTAKPLLKYQPQMIYGHTQQSPNHFVNRHTIYFNATTQSEFAKKKSEGHLPSVQTQQKPPLKTVFRHGSEQFHISSQHRKISSRERATDVKRESKEEGQDAFDITRGQFSSFLDKHKHYGSLGTIHKQNQLGQTHKLSWNRSNHTESNGQPASIKSKMSLPSSTIEADRSVLNHSKQSSFGMTRSNSVSIFEKVARKSELKLRRDEFIGLMRKEVREKLDKKYGTFGLPRLGVEHELFLLEKVKPAKQPGISEMDEINHEINRFQQSLFYKLK